MEEEGALENELAQMLEQGLPSCPPTEKDVCMDPSVGRLSPPDSIWPCTQTEIESSSVGMLPSPADSFERSQRQRSEPRSCGLKRKNEATVATDACGSSLGPGAGHSGAGDEDVWSDASEPTVHYSPEWNGYTEYKCGEILSFCLYFLIYMYSKL